eukprot:3023549-Amphidinium_carterae.1
MERPPFSCQPLCRPQYICDDCQETLPSRWQVPPRSPAKCPGLRHQDCESCLVMPAGCKWVLSSRCLVEMCRRGVRPCCQIRSARTSAYDRLQLREYGTATRQE